MIRVVARARRGRCGAVCGEEPPSSDRAGSGEQRGAQDRLDERLILALRAAIPRTAGIPRCRSFSPEAFGMGASTMPRHRARCDPRKEKGRAGPKKPVRPR
jgi:hypothetical protein